MSLTTPRIKLCKSCKEIDFAEYQNSKGIDSVFESSPELNPHSLGSVVDILSKATSCSFCKLLSQLWDLLSSCYKDERKLAPADVECVLTKDGVPECYALTTCVGETSLGRWTTPIVPHVRFSWISSPRTGANDGSQAPLTRRDARNTQIDPLLRLWLSPQGPGNSGRAIRTRSEQEASLGLLNYDLIKSWLRHCCAQPACNKDANASKSRSLTLLDVIERKIVRAPPNTRYTALSYVWGDAATYPGQGELVLPSNTQTGAVSKRNAVLNVLKYAISHSSSRRGGWRDEGTPLPVALPQTIADACQITKSLGERYMWVDSFCIDQNNEVKKREEIQNMDTIYENAFLCLVAAEGTHANAGIAGVSRPLLLTAQPCVETLAGKLQATFWRDLTDSFDEWPWNRRAWTLQEVALSPRVLFLDQYNYSMRCRYFVYIDILDHYYDSENASSTIHGDFYCGSVFKMDWYSEAIEQYTSRRLSFASDILNAVSGLFTRVQRNTGVSFYWGLPQNTSFISSLLWIKAAETGLSRRESFPSWSWCGWHGRVSYDTYSLAFTPPKGQQRYQWNVTLEEQTVRREAAFHIPKDSESKPQMVHLAAPMCKASVEVWTDEDGRRRCKLEGRTHGPANLNDTMASLDELQAWPDGVHEVDAVQVQHVSLRHQTERPPLLFCLLVQPKGDNWQRVGLAKLRSDSQSHNFVTGNTVTLE